MSNITLTAGIRQNLLSLQQTSADLTTTQEALATGNKVNSAAENPSAYFTSQNLTNTANSLSALLDQVGQGSQTISAATDGLTGLTSLLQQALSTAQQAQQAATGTVDYSGPPAGTTEIAADTTLVTGTTAISGLPTGITASVQSKTGINATGIGDLTDGNTLVFQLGSDAAVTATFGATNNATTNEFSTAAGLVSVLNSGGAGNLGGEAVATSDGSGGVVAYSNDLTNDFAAVGGTGITSDNVPTGDVFNDALSLGSALTITDGTHTSNFYYVGQNAQPTNDTFTSAANLISAINSNSLVGHYITASTTSGGDLQLSNSAGSVAVSGVIGTALGIGTGTADDNYNATLATVTGNVTVQVGSNTAHTLTFGTGAGEISTLAELTTQLSGFTDINAGVNASNEITLTPTSTADVTIGGTTATLTALGLSAGTTTPVATVITANSTRSTLQTNYNGLLTQINQLASDASYNGVNLLTSDNLVVDFNQSGSSSLTIEGVNDSSTGLGLSTLSANQFQDNNSINTVISNINAAIASVQSQTETFGTNSGVIGTRQTFTTALINTLQTGASNLVAADQNEESADLLTEQTQQQLEISALSIANQANQSVLKLFS
jgi:flagellin